MQYILYGDETNVRPVDGAEFFIYGAVWLPVDKLTNLNASVAAIRVEHGFREQDVLKFNTRSRPRHIRSAEHTEAKKAVLKASWDVGLLFAAECVLHDITGTSPHRGAYQIDPVILSFHEFLETKEARGMVILDRTPGEDAFEYGRQRFQGGVVMETTGHLLSTLDRIDLFGVSAISASHLASVADIVLGSFRYCVNDLKGSLAARAILPNVAALMWHSRSGDIIQVQDRGLLLRPRIVKVEAYRKRYEALTERLNQVMRQVDDWRGPHPEAG